MTAPAAPTLRRAPGRSRAAQQGRHVQHARHARHVQHARHARHRPLAWSERGSMTVEVAFLLVLLVVPLFYLVATLGRMQAGAYAVSAAAREAGRAFVTADDPASAQVRAAAAADLVLGAHGFDPGEGHVELACSADCLAPGSQVLVEARVEVLLPLVPDFMRGHVPSSVGLGAEHLETVDEFRPAG